MTLLYTNLDGFMKQGNTPILRFALYNKDGSNFDVTQPDLSGIWMLKKNADAEASATKPSGSGLSFTAPNFADVQMGIDDTSSISGKYMHELALKDSDGNVYTVVNLDGSNGTMLINKRIAVVP